MSPVTIYTKTGCPYCAAAKKHYTDQGMPFEEINVTERPETLECGSNILSGTETESIIRCVKTVLTLESKWETPREYLVENVSLLVSKLLILYNYKIINNWTYHLVSA